MSIDFNFFMALLFTTPSAVVLSVCIGAGGCLRPRNSRVCWAGMASLQLMYRAPILASAVDDMTALMICEIVRMAPLFVRNCVVVGHEKVSSCPASCVGL